MRKVWSLGDVASQAGKLAIVTGATGGLGYETALGLARAGAAVWVTGRNAEKGRVAIDQMRGLAPAATVSFELLDLASLASIRAFAGRTLSTGKPLDILINNAGVMDLPGRQLTEDGFERQFGTNHLGHFALTGLLLPALRAAQLPRVVNVSSIAHREGKIDFSNLQGERTYKPWPAYQQTKLANLLFTLELQRRSDAYGWGLSAITAHPGWARTDIIPNGPGTGSRKAVAAKVLGPILSHSAEAGALPILFAAVSPEAKALGYYGPGGIWELKGPVKPAIIFPRAKDEAVARRLWEVSEELTGVRWSHR